jgi:hypothetical protein
VVMTDGLGLLATELAQACADRGKTPPSLTDFIADHTRPSRVR